MKNHKVVGIFVSPEDYEVLSGKSLGQLMESRMKGETVSQGEAEKFIADRAAARRKRTTSRALTSGAWVRDGNKIGNLKSQTNEKAKNRNWRKARVLNLGTLDSQLFEI